ncbi:MAG: ABC transporter permease subunit [Candidatus Bathyarchaeia archaeon]
MAGIMTIAKKELLDIFSERKFLLIFGTLLIVVLVSTFQGAISYSSSQSTTGMQIRGNMTQLGGSGRAIVIGSAEGLSNTLSSMVTNFSLVGGVLALAISFDTINGERQTGSMKTLLSYPIYRDKIIYGKYLGGLIVVTIVSAITFLAGIGIFVGFSGLPMTGDTVMRLGLFFLISLVYMAIFLGVGLLLSIVMPQPSTSLLASMIVWLASIRLIPNIGYAIAQIMYPVRMTFSGNTSGFSTPQGFDSIRTVISALSPSTTYEQIVNNILTTSRLQFSSGNIATVSISLEQTLQTSAPYIIYFAGLLIAIFAAAYFVFMRQEIR